MKKLVVLFLAACLAVGTSACSKSETSNEQSGDAAETAVTVTDAVGSDKEKFQVIPEEANPSFNTVINAAKTVCPIGKGINRQYGYMGKEKIGGVECYLFSVYDFDKESGSVKVGDFAKAVNEDAVYRIGDNGFEPIELTRDEYELTLSKKGSTEATLKKAANLAAERIIAG